MRQKCSIYRQVSFDDKGSFSMKAITISVAIAAAISPAAAHAEDFLGGRIAVVGGWDGVNVDVDNIGGTALNLDETHDGATFGQLGRAHVCTPVPNAHRIYRLLLDKKTQI